MNRDVTALAKENERLRATLRSLQAQQGGIPPAQALAVVANALDERDRALAVAARITSVLLKRDASRGVQLVGNGHSEHVIELTAADMASVDGTGLAIEPTDGGGFRLALRPAPARPMEGKPG